MKRTLLLCAVLFVAWAGAASAATITSTATGGAWATKATWVGNAVPATGDTVIIATTGAGSVNIAANLTQTAAGSVTVNSGAVLTSSGGTTVLGALTINSGGSATFNRNTTILGATNITGNLSFTSATARTIAFTGAVTLNSGAVWNETTANTFTFSNNFTNNATTFTAFTGTHTFAGTGMTMSGATNTSIPNVAVTGTRTNNGTLTVTTALTGAGTLTNGATGILHLDFTGTVGITTLNASTAGNTVEYGFAGAQTVKAGSYSNLIFSNSGAKSILAGTLVTNNLSIAPTGTATASVGAGLTITANALTLGGLGRINGTWGSTASAATYKDNNYFAATTGIVSVTTDTRINQATLSALATPSTIPFGTTSTVSSSGGSGTGTVSFSIGASTGCALNGTTLSVIDAAGTCAVTASKTADTAYFSATSAPFTVTLVAAPTHQLFLSGPASGTAGTRLGYTVTRKDAYGNLKAVGSEVFYPYTYSTGTAARFYDAATGGNVITSLTIANGTSSANIWYYDELAGNQNIAVSDTTPPNGATGIIDATSTVAITAAATSQLSLTQNTTMTAGTRLAYTVTRKDQFGNLVTSGSDIANLSSNSTGAAKKFYDAASGGNIITSATIGSGASSANFWYYDELATNAIVTAHETGLVDGTNAITILPAATGIFTFNSASSTMQVGTRVGLTVSRTDRFGNTVTSGSNTVYLTSNSTGAKAFYNVASGGTPVTQVVIGSGASNAALWYYDDAAGTWTITGYDNIAGPDGATGITDATSSVIVSPAPIVATRFTIVKPADNIAGATVPVTIRAENNTGNLDTTYNNSVTLVTSGHATPQNGVVVTITNGLGTVNITDTVAETVTLSLIDSATTTLDVSSTQTVTFSVGPTAQYTISTPGNMTAGTRLGYTVTRKDAFGNLVTAGAETVNLSSNATGGLSAFYDSLNSTTTIASVSIASSSSVASFWYYEGKAGSWTVTAANIGGSVQGTRAVTVSPAATSQFSLNHPSDSMMAGTRLGYTVTRLDQFGNLATTGSNVVYLYANPASASSKFYSAGTGGSVITSRTIGAGVSTANFWYYDEAPGTVTVTASDNATAPDYAVGIADASDSFTVTAVPITPTRFTMLKPADVLVGANTTVTIRAEDNSGNVDTTFHSSVTLVTSGSATGGGVVNFTNGVGTKTITDATAETVTLTLLDTASTTLDISSSQTVTFSTTPPPAAPAAVGGTTSVTRSTVIFAGKVFPGAKLTIVAVGDGDIPVRQGTVASGDGSFSIRFNGMAAGIRTFFLSVTDQDGKSSQTKTYSVDVNQSLVVRDVLLPPTINFARQTVTKGGFVGITGHATPGFAVQATIDGVDTGAINIADSSGKYSIPVNTFNLSLGNHTARTHQTSTEGITSDASIEGTFMVSTLFDSQTDLNHDGRVDSTDLSIFLSRWNSPDPAVRLTGDFNGDGKLDVQDLSIFSRTLNK